MEEAEERHDGRGALSVGLDPQNFEENELGGFDEHVEVVLENEVFLCQESEEVDELEEVLFVVQVLQDFQEQNKVEADEGSSDFPGQTVPVESGLVEQPNIQRQRPQELLQNLQQEVLDEEGGSHMQQQQQTLVVVDETVHVVRVEVVQLGNLE